MFTPSSITISVYVSYFKGHITVRCVMIFTSLDENASWLVCGQLQQELS